jgi:hypothetical protein
VGVEIQEDDGGQPAEPLVAVDEWMVAWERVEQRGGFQ